jgi:16S rRNA (cytidine1402-2'-O)-methyltransferase
MPGTLFVVATPIGNLEDITLRALRVLREVAVIAAEDTRRTGQLLARHAVTTPTTSLHEHNEPQKTPALINRLRHGEDIALVSDAGTPTISDPGNHLIQQAIAAGVPVVPIPGPSAVIAALAASGLPTGRFSFLGFPPIRSSARTEWFQTLAASRGTVVFFEAPHRILQTLIDLRQAIGDRTVAVVRELTKVHEQLVRGPISSVLAQGFEPRGEFTVVADVGHEPETAAVSVPTPSELAEQFRELTETPGITRRRALAQLAKRHGLAPNALYDALESAKRSG